MKQIVQNYYTGKLEVADVPVPLCTANRVLVKTEASLISTGTERSVITLGEKSLLGKALERPDLMRQVMGKMKTDGLLETFHAAMARLDNPVPLGYSSAGIVLDVGKEVEVISKGDRVACVGSGYASHAEVVSIPQNFCVKIPENIDLESASFIALGGISLHALRLAKVSLGDKVAVIGLGLLGQITIQLLRVAGCHVFGIDLSPGRVEMAITRGAQGGAPNGDGHALAMAREFAPEGFDAVIIMAATKSNQPLELGAEVAKEKARVVAAGLIGLNVPRKPFFDKELELVVSRAWGPGAFDPDHSERNGDHSYAYTRGSAKRNLKEFLSSISQGSVNVKDLITHRFLIEKALEAYDLIRSQEASCLGVVLRYSSNLNEIEKAPRVLRMTSDQRFLKHETGRMCVGLIGAGLFAKSTLLPVLKSMKRIELKGLATASGTTAHHIGRKFGFEYITTDYQELLRDNTIDLVYILTRHGSHANLVIEALSSGKNVFVEKPLCLNEQELAEILKVYTSRLTPNASRPVLMVGFNRRFSRFSTWLKDKFKTNFKAMGGPLSVHCTVNAGPVPGDHWTYDPLEGGGRIIGEVCHFVDLIQYITGSVPTEAFAQGIDAEGQKNSDNVSITMKLRNGSLGSILYVANGDKRFPRERIEVFGGGCVGVIDNFRTASFIQQGRSSRIRNWFGIDRGHRQEMRILQVSVQGGKGGPVSFEEYAYTSLATFAAEKSLRTGSPVEITWQPGRKV